MSFLELAMKRHSVRKYKDTHIEEEKLKLVLEAGRLAPSACNYQPWYFIVIRDAEVKEKIAETYSKFNRSHYKSAPMLIVICGDHNKSWRRSMDGKDYCDVDIAIAVDHMTLEAADLGLGTCWIGSFDADKCGEVLGLPQHLEPIVIIHIGYPEDELMVEKDKPRKSLEEIVCIDRFSC